MKILALLSIFLALPAFGQEGFYGEAFPLSSVSDVNDPTDTDGDALPDFIACGDYDGDSSLEMQDILSCQAALTDTYKHLYVMPGSYSAPAAVISGQSRAIIELASNTTLECAGSELVTLNAAQWIDGSDATRLDRAVVGSDDGGTVNNIAIINCGMNGDMPATWYFEQASDVNLSTDVITLQADAADGDHGFATGDGPFRLTQIGAGSLPTGFGSSTDYWIIRESASTVRIATSQANALAGTDVDATALGTNLESALGPSVSNEGLGTTGAGMGIYIKDADGVVIRGNRIRNTAHSGIYLSNTRHFEIVDNYVDQVGSFGNRAVTLYPGVYLFATGGGRTSDGLIEGNRISRAGGNAYNTRADDHSAGDRMQRLSFTNNYAWRYQSACVAIYSGRQITVNDLECIEGETLIVTDNTVAAWSDQNTLAASNGTIGVLFEGIHGKNLTHDSSYAIQIGAYHDGIELRNISIDGMLRGPCMLVTTPQRRFLVDGMYLKKCGTNGIVVNGTNTIKEEGVTFRNLHIDHTDFETGLDASSADDDAIQIASGVNGFFLENFSIAGQTNRPIRFLGNVTDVTIRNGYVDGKPPGFRGYASEATLAAYARNKETLRHTFVVNNSDAAECDFWDAATGTTQYLCQLRSDCVDNFATGGPPEDTGSANGECDSDGTTLVWTFTSGTIGSNSEQQDAPAIEFAGAVARFEIGNIYGVEINDEPLLLITGAGSNGLIYGLTSSTDTSYYSGTSQTDTLKSEGLFQIASTASNITVVGESMQCINCDSTATHYNIADDDITDGSLIKKTACSATCVSGAKCIDTDNAQDSLYLCKNTVWQSALRGPEYLLNWWGATLDADDECLYFGEYQAKTSASAACLGATSWELSWVAPRPLYVTTMRTYIRLASDAGYGCIVQIRSNGSNVGTALTVPTSAATYTNHTQAQGFAVAAGEIMEVQVLDGAAALICDAGTNPIIFVELWGYYTD